MSTREAKPTSMRHLRQWVGWRREERGGKSTKVPYSPVTGSRARSDDPETWGTLAQAQATAGRENYDGIGFVFTASDPFCGVDLDKCLNPETGEVEPWALEIVEELGSYTEISPSGTGLHVIVRAELPEGRRREGRVEMYDRGRFFTVTRRSLPGTPRAVESRQDRIDTLHARLFPRREDGTSRNVASAFTDAQILRRAMSAANGDRFARLWTGDRSGYASDSEADLAFCSMLAFWTGPNEGRIASLFTRSGLNREKWSREDYRRRTIARTLTGATEFYSPRENGLGPSHDGYSPYEAGSASGDAFTSLPALPEAPPFLIEAMPAACRQLIREAEAALGCAPELVALPILAALSSAIGTSRIVEVKGGWREWAALFLAVVASPGAMKTPAAKVAKKPVFDLQRKLGKAYAEDK